MSELEREIKKYPHILSWTGVRGEGSVYAEHKNRCLWKVCGKPMIQWVMEAAKKSKYIDKIAVNTESEEIKEVLRKIGGITIIDRPLWTALAYPRDFTKGTFRRNKPRSLQSQEASIYTNLLDYSFYYLNKTEQYKPDMWINLGANEPLITSKILDKLVEAFLEDEEASCVVGVTPIMPYIYTINSVTKRLFPVFDLTFAKIFCISFELCKMSFIFYISCRGRPVWRPANHGRPHRVAPTINHETCGKNLLKRFKIYTSILKYIIIHIVILP